jgi:hypothetical protein
MVVFIEDMLDLLYNQSQSGVQNDTDISIDAGAFSRIDAIELVVGAQFFDAIHRVDGSIRRPYSE